MIDPARLRHLAGTLTDIAGELLQMADQAEPASSAPSPRANVAPTDPRSWYRARVAHLVAQGQTSSRQQDYLEALASGLPLTRDEVRALRAELAPPDWTRPGRPRLVSAA